MGSDQEFHDMVAFVNEHQIKPVVDSIYDVSESETAYERMRQGKNLARLSSGFAEMTIDKKGIFDIVRQAPTIARISYS